MSATDKKEPAVKLHPDFTVGETVTHLGGGSQHKILALNPAENLVRLEGLATWSPLHIIAKIS